MLSSRLWPEDWVSLDDGPPKSHRMVLASLQSCWCWSLALASSHSCPSWAVMHRKLASGVGLLSTSISVSVPVPLSAVWKPDYKRFSSEEEDDNLVCVVLGAGTRSFVFVPGGCGGHWITVLFRFLYMLLLSPLSWLWRCSQTDLERLGCLRTSDLEVAEVQRLAAEPHSLVVAVRWLAVAANQTVMAELEVQLQEMELQLELENFDQWRCIYRGPPMPWNLFVTFGKSSFMQILFTLLPHYHYPVTLLHNEVVFFTRFCCCILWLTFPSPSAGAGAEGSLCSATVSRGVFLNLHLPWHGGGITNAEAAKSASEKFI